MVEISAADRIRRKQRLKQTLAEIVENLHDYFNELQLKKFGKESRFVVLSDIRSVHKVGSKGLQLVTGEFNSELGSLILTIAIKNFPTQEEAMHNKVLTNNLATKLKDTGILTPRVIFEHGTMLIYEGIQGDTFYDSPLDPNLKLRMAGEALSKYHSLELRAVDKNRYIFVIKKVLKELVLTPERKHKFIDQAGNFLGRILTFTQGGTASFGDFHPGNILFSPEKDASGNEWIQTWLIDPEYAEEERAADRMEDIGTFFLHSAIDNFNDTTTLVELKRETTEFFNGYERHLSMNGLSLNEIYSGRQESALVFHLGLNVLLEALFIQKRGNLENKEVFSRMAVCIGLANYLWNIGFQ
ncbi:MAG: phosphotransferase family protein [Candidatus Hodarchaeales archaeon]|jgi:hypothetical protein